MEPNLSCHSSALTDFSGMIYLPDASPCCNTLLQVLLVVLFIRHLRNLTFTAFPPENFNNLTMTGQVSSALKWLKKYILIKKVQTIKKKAKRKRGICIRLHSKNNSSRKTRRHRCFSCFHFWHCAVFLKQNKDWKGMIFPLGLFYASPAPHWGPKCGTGGTVWRAKLCHLLVLDTKHV